VLHLELRGSWIATSSNLVAIWMNRRKHWGFCGLRSVCKSFHRFESMQYTDLSHWFGEPNPPGWQPEPFA